MDLLQIALIFLIMLLSIFLSITGIQVFFILRDLKKALDRFNQMLKSGETIVEDVQKPITQASDLISGLIKKDPKPKAKRFYKRSL